MLSKPRKKTCKDFVQIWWFILLHCMESQKDRFTQIWSCSYSQRKGLPAQCQDGGNFGAAGVGFFRRAHLCHFFWCLREVQTQPVHRRAKLSDSAWSSTAVAYTPQPGTPTEATCPRSSPEVSFIFVRRSIRGLMNHSSRSQMWSWAAVTHEGLLILPEKLYFWGMFLESPAF